MQEVNNIIRILEEAQEAFKQSDASKIKELSNQTINTASLTQDPDNIAVAVVVYAIGKILEREHYKQLPNWKSFQNNVELQLQISIKNLENKNEQQFRKHFTKLRKTLEGLSGKVKDYIQDVFTKAKINKASRIYEHGVSMEQTAKLLGISMYELAEYSGGDKRISDIPETKTLSTKDRIKLALEMFE